MEIEVKCPKCRFRFDTEVHRGATEITTACPRCGSPFSHVLDEEVIQEALAQTEEVKEPVLNDVSTENQEHTTEEVKAVQNHNESNAIAPQKQSVYTPKAPQLRPNRIERLPKNYATRPLNDNEGKGKVIGVVAFVIVLVLGCLYLFKGFLFGENSNQFTEASKYVNDLQYDSLKVVKDNAFSSAADTVGFNGIKPQKSPAWIQGIWRATTDYGVITLKIKGNTIIESIEDLSSEGTFFYNDGVLYCTFPEKTKMRYYLDTDNLVIQLDKLNAFTKKR